MNSNKVFWCIFALCVLFAIVFDGFLGGNGLGTVIGYLVFVVFSLVAAVLTSIDNSKARALAAANAAAKPVSTQPIFAHVPGPGEPGYDPTYDPDEDKYGRRYYGGKDD